MLETFKGRKVVAAVSGGADSVCLLLLLKVAGARVSAMHCNHGLRGRASDADERFVKELCRRERIGLAVYRRKMAKGSGLEERARDWRRECYARAAKRFGAAAVCLGHHAWDQAETVLMNLARGAGLKGAGGMRPESRVKGLKILRPLLEEHPADLRAWLEARGQAWREDASNQREVSKRNLLRAKVLPVLEGLLPGAPIRLAAFARRAREAEEALEGLGQQALKKARLGRGWSLASFKKAEPFLRRRMVMALMPDLDEAALERAELLISRGRGKADLKRGISLEASRGLLFVRK